MPEHLPTPATIGGRPPATRDGSVAAVRHAVAILRCVSEAAGAVGINEIARQVGLHKSSVSRLVATLAGERLVRRDPETDKVVLAVGLAALAAPVLADLGLRDVARPHLARLAHDSGETASVSVWDGSCAVSVAQALGARAVRTYAAPGRRNPGHATAAGKALLAHAGADAIALYCDRQIARFTATTITDPDKLRDELALIRERGYAFNRGELEEDVGAVSAIVRDRRGVVVGTVTATVPLYRLGPERMSALALLVQQASAAIVADLPATSDDLAGREGA